MACSNSTPNNRPVGIGYNTREEPTGLVELTTVSLSSINATSGSFSSVYTNNVQTPTGSTLVFNGVVSAVAYLGASGSGAANLVELGDVAIPALVDVPNEILVVNNAQVITSSMAELIAEHQLTTDDELAAELANYATVAALNGHTSNHTLSASLSDVNISSPTVGQVLAWHAASQRWMASSIPIGGGAGVTDHGALTGLLDNDHPQYASSSVSALITAVEDDIATHTGDSTIHFTSGSLSGAYSLTSHSHSFSSHSSLSNLNANDHPQYVLSATNNTLSSNVASHIADSTIHFTSGSLSGAYSLLTHSHSYSSVSFLGLTDTPNNYSDPSVGSVPVVNAAKDALEFVPSSIFAGGSPGGSTTQVQFNNGGAFSGDPALTWTQSTTTLSATYLRAVDITLGGSDGRIINNNGNIIVSALNGTVVFPTGLSALALSGGSLSGLSDVQITGPVVDGQSLKWSANKWINETPPDAGAGGIDELAGVNPVYTSPSSVSASFENGSPFIWESSSTSWAGKNLSSWVAQDLNKYLSGAFASSSVSANYSPTSHSHSFSSHSALSNLNANDHPQYTLSSTNSALSSLVSNHIASAVHWTVSELNANYLNSSGGTANANFYLQNLSSLNVSATSYSGISLSSTLRDVMIGSPSNDQSLVWSASIQKWVPKTITGGAGISNLYEAADVVAATFPPNIALTEGALIHFAAGSEKWEGIEAAAWISAQQANITHNSIGGLTTGDPHTQYAKKAGDVFTGPISATLVSATNFSGISLSSTLRDVQIAGPTAGQLLGWNGNFWVASSIPSGGSTSPGGSTTQVQFNNDGAFSGSPQLTWNQATSSLSATTVSAVNLNQKVISSIEEWIRVVLPTDFTTTATAAGTSSTLSAILPAGFFYEVNANLIMSSNTATVGARFGLPFYAPFTASSHALKYTAPTNVTTGVATLFPSAVASQVLATTAVPAIDKSWLGRIEGTFELSGTGNIAVPVLFNAETTGTVRLCRGSFIKFRKYTLTDP